MTGECTLILNAAAGRGRWSVADLRRLSRERGLDPAAVETHARGDADAAARSAARAGVPLVIAAGGDGTVSEAANGLAGTETVLAIVPIGTANVLARELGIPQAVGLALETAACGRDRAIDVGAANGRVFTFACGVGFDAEVVRAVSPWWKRRAGRFAYVAAAARCAMRAHPTGFRLTVDGDERSVDAYEALVCGTTCYAGRYRLSGAARIDDGVMELYTVTGGGRMSLARAVAAIVLDRVDRCACIEQARFRELLCETRSPVCVELDGDAAGRSPVRVRVLPGALHVRVPAEGA